MTTENIDISINRKGSGGRVIKRELDDIADSADKVDTRLKSMNKTALVVGGAIGSILGGAAVMLYKGFTNAATSIKDTYTAAKQLGTTTTIFSQLDFAARSYDMTTKDLAASLEGLQQSQVKAAKGNTDQAKLFRQLGIAVTDVTGQLRETPEVLRDISDIFQKMPDGTNKSALAMKLFGNQNREMIALLSQGSKGLDEMAKKSDELGYTVKEETAKDLKEFYDQMDDVKLQVEAMYRQALPTLIPLLKDLSGTLDSQEFKDGFNAIIQGAAQAIVWLAKFATTTANVTKFIGEEIAARVGGTDPRDTVRVEQRIERLQNTMRGLDRIKDSPVAGWFSADAMNISELKPSDLLKPIDEVRARIQSELDQEQNKLKIGVMLNDQEASASLKAIQDAANEPASTGNAPNIDWTGGNGGNGKKDRSAEKEARDLARLTREYESLLMSINPVLAAEMQLADARDIMAQAVDKLGISQEQANEYLKQYEQSLKDQLDPLGALNDELAEQLRISQLLGDERIVEQQVFSLTEQLRRAGIELTKEQTEALRDQLGVLQEMDKLGAAKESILANSSGRQMEMFQIDLKAFEELKGKLTEGDQFNWLNQMLGGSLDETQSAFDARIEQFSMYYDMIEQFRQQDVANEALAAEAKRAIKRQEMDMYINATADGLGQVAQLMNSSNKHAFKVGQAAAIAQVAIKTPQAAMDAYSSLAGIPYVGPFLGAAAAAAAVVMGMQQISKIRSQTPPAYRTGGEYVVGGSGGIDSQNVHLRATPGERISINTPAQARAMERLAERAADQQPQVFNSSVTIVQQGRAHNRTSEQEARALTKAQRRQFERNN